MKTAFLYCSLLGLVLAPAGRADDNAGAAADPARLHADSGGAPFGVFKNQVYLQTSSSTPTLGGVPNFPSYAGTIESPLAANVTEPGLTATALPYNSGNSDYEQDGAFTGQAAFTAAFPDGSYQIAASGEPTATLPIIGDLYPATVPQVIGGTWQNNVLVVNAAQANTLNISTFASYASTAGGQVAGLMTMKISSATDEDNVNLKQQYVTNSSLSSNGLTYSLTPFTTFSIPVNTLTPGLVYDVEVEFYDLTVLSTSLVPGYPVVGGYGNATEFFLAAQSPNPPAAPVITQQPTNVSGPLGSSVTFTANFTPTQGSTANPTNFGWYSEGQSLPSGSKYIYGPNGNLTVTNLAASDAGTYVMHVFNASGLALSNQVTLSIGAATGAPVITTQPNSIGNSITINGTGSGTTVALTVAASNATSYQWQLNGQNVSQGNASGATSPTLLLTGASSINAGSYACVVSGPGGSVTSNAVQLSTVLNPSSPGRLGNLSVLTQAGNGSKPLTVGFEVGGAGVTGSQTLLIRGDGPLLAGAPFNKTGTLASPVISLFSSSSTLLASNSGWSSNQAAVTAAETNTYAYPLATGSLDAAMVNTLAPALYSVQVTGNPNGTGSGLALAEVYDDTPAGTYTLTTPRLINLSCLAQVNAGAANNLTAGFVIGGTTAKTVLIRAWGPALVPAPFSVSGAMPDPQLQVYNSSDVLLASNVGWGGNPQIVAAGNSVYDYAWTNANSADSAVLITLPPGNYTAQASSVSGTAGTTLVEVFEVP